MSFARTFGLMAAFLFSFSALAGEPSELCDGTAKCHVLAGTVTGDQPRLADLVADIVMILDSPELKWVHTRDRPPATVSLKLAEFLRTCFDKVMKLKNFVVHQCLAAAPPDEEPKIVEHPIPWPPERESLMREYLQKHTGDGSTYLKNPTTIVTHWTGTNNLDETIKGFERTRLEGRPELAAAGLVNVSCHFIVDRDGTIYRMMPDDRTGRHAVGMNRNALCIENIGGPTHPLTKEQLRSNELLIESLVARHPTIDNVIGHSEYRNFENTYIFSERTGYRSDRDAEPGRAFLAQLRLRLFERGERIKAAGRCNL
ncbi:MAG: N-acetylmuramoyl-L-alanine amidase [Deltaproteobacteria bacterium]|nr:N-acetylmuramoyl-L-alanine amidase [Deltaproteobacteria bacterium]